MSQIATEPWQKKNQWIGSKSNHVNLKLMTTNREREKWRKRGKSLKLKSESYSILFNFSFLTSLSLTLSNFESSFQTFYLKVNYLLTSYDEISKASLHAAFSTSHNHYFKLIHDLELKNKTLRIKLCSENTFCWSPLFAPINLVALIHTCLVLWTIKTAYLQNVEKDFNLALCRGGKIVPEWLQYSTRQQIVSVCTR